MLHEKFDFRPFCPARTIIYKTVTNSGNPGRKWAGATAVLGPVTGSPKDENLKLRREENGKPRAVDQSYIAFPGHVHPSPGRPIAVKLEP